MSSLGDVALKRTSLYATHLRSGARMVDFGGWEMPIQYTSILAEHRAVRTQAGLFDVSHMGEVEVSGPGGLETIQRLVTNDASRLVPGQGMYTPMCTPTGGIVDDLTVFRLDEHRWWMVINAATTAKDVAWMEAHRGTARIRNLSTDAALLALQGPRAQRILQGLTAFNLAGLAFFYLAEDIDVAGVLTKISRTGYTGEDGFELACAWDAAPSLWDALIVAGNSEGLVPVGLGARDTLRLEAGLMLYGSDIDETTTPLEAPLGWTVKWEKGEFIGREALLRQKGQTTARKLVGFEMEGRAIPRHGYPLLSSDGPVGHVTSGSFSPTVNKGIGMGYVSKSAAASGTAITVDARGQRAEARVVRLPFYRRAAR